MIYRHFTLISVCLAVGCAGTTQCISLDVFTQSLIQCLSIRSKKHADKILCPKTGAQIFPTEATYFPCKIWKKIQDFKVCRLLLRTNPVVDPGFAQE